MASELITNELVLRLAQRAAKRYRRRPFWVTNSGLVEPGDLATVAKITVYDAASTFDPSYGIPFEAYAWKAIERQLSDACWKMSSPVSGGLHDPRTHIAGVHRTELEDVYPIRFADPAAVLDEVQFRLRTRRALRRLAGRTQDGDMAVEVMLDGRAPTEVARARGRDVRDVYSAVELVRRKVRRSPRMYRLLRKQTRR
jgi:hypothetical protein